MTSLLSYGFNPGQSEQANGLGFEEEKSPTLCATGSCGGGVLVKQDKAVCYGICSDRSNSMLSSNPDSGIYEANTSRTLDLNGGNPSCNQGGVAVCEPSLYDMTHANDVIRDCGGRSPTLQNRMGTGGNQIPITVSAVRWIVRRLTPTECERLQGYPDGVDGHRRMDGLKRQETQGS